MKKVIILAVLLLLAGCTGKPEQPVATVSNPEDVIKAYLEAEDTGDFNKAMSLLWGDYVARNGKEMIMVGLTSDNKFMVKGGGLVKFEPALKYKGNFNRYLVTIHLKSGKSYFRTLETHFVDGVWKIAG